MPNLAEIAKLAEAILSWPVAAVAIIVVVVFNIRKVAIAFRKFPIIRKLTIYGVEFHLDEGETRQLKKVTDETFKRLISDADTELRKFARISGLDGAIEAAAQNVLTNRPSSSKQFGENNKKPDFRATLHIPDPVFVDQLYQVSEYCRRSRQARFWFSQGSAGRRFSIRYGIIGLAWRSRASQAVDKAFQGEDEEAKEDLIRQWSMLPEQAESAAQKPSCLAVALKEPDTNEMLGIFYADAEIPDFFGEDPECHKYAEDCEELPAMIRLRERLIEFRKLSIQISVGFDLVKIGQK
ncbi:MAG: hypothetical protein CL803_03495 [Citromicrobium sp.]|nr:hypothetical protein [Citromicrobium sp.]MAO95435.1 hypothetical protein [Citromicrobium sp.]MBT47554.1 hypothetical protein [Citromicrobium sp.]